MEDLKFQQTYRFVIMVTIFVFIYLFTITVIPISADNRDNIKTILIFLLGYMSANGNYLTGGNPTPKKADTAVVGDNTTVNTNNEEAKK